MRFSSRVPEAAEQAAVVRELRRLRIRFCAVPNGGRRDRIESINLKRQGVEPGAPDLLILTPPPAWPWSPGTALEMKRTGAQWSDVRKEQVEWLTELAVLGWYVVVGYGAADALEKLRKAGYYSNPK